MLTPFSISPNPNSFYITDAIKSVIHKNRFVIDKRQGLSVVQGGLGLGKSTVLRYLFTEYDARDDCRAHLIATPNYSSVFAFLKVVSDAFGIEAARSRQAQEKKFGEFLKNEFLDEKNVILFIDEAQNLDNSQLELIRQILNFETDEQKLVQVILAGQLELSVRLKHQKNRALYSRVVTTSTLPPLEQVETAEMIRRRCEYAEIENPFDAATIKAIHEKAKGVPRAVLKLCALIYDLKTSGVIETPSAQLASLLASEVAL